MQCILCKIYFSKVFHKYYNFIWTPICTKFLFLQKVGVTDGSRALLNGEAGFEAAGHMVALEPSSAMR
jgi:hypothetical protein